MAVLNVTSENFEQEILKEDRMVLVDFWAEWCMPCKMLSPIVDQIADEMPEIKVCKVNIDEQPSLAAEYKVMSIPTLIMFKDGKQVNQSIGVQAKDDIKAMLA
ncbi:MAG: thioredoxin [Lachnospiraceae bacterium]|nr:thioredoxin [Lachnospiraceae bacterium]